MAVIAVPTDKHLDILNELKMFENLKYVILEKPAGMNHFEAETIQRLALENDWKCYINYIRRADKSVAQIKESLKKHTEVQVRCFFNGNWLNIGVHFIDLLLHIFQLFGKNYSIATSKNKLFIEYNYVSISIEKIHFNTEIKNFYEFYIFTPEKKFYYLDGGYDVFSKNMNQLTEEKMLIDNDMLQYQKFFYETLSAIIIQNQENKILCDINQNVEVHRILKEVQEC